MHQRSAGYKRVDKICRAAMTCRQCFRGRRKPGEILPLNPALIDLPQPGWIGPNYWTASKKTLLLLLNPGAGKSESKRESNEFFKKILYEYREGKVGLIELLSYEKKHMEGWGTPKRRFLDFYLDGLNLDFDEIAFANIAWCADEENKHPKEMLHLCFQKHTSSLITAIVPDVILLSGSGTHSFLAQVRSIAPKAEVITMMHYAHREGKEKEKRELDDIRAKLHKNKIKSAEKDMKCIVITNKERAKKERESDAFSGETF